MGEVTAGVTAIGGGWDTGVGKAINPWPYTNGYTCPSCGGWIGWGMGHLCPNTITSPNINIWQEVRVSDHELDQLGKVVKALEDARTCFGNLKEKDESNRVLAYLANRLGIKEGALIDVLVEE